MTPKTRAVMIAHSLGNPFDVVRAVDICCRNDLWLVEDGGDAISATIAGQGVGTFADLATLSFYPAHHITTDEGGTVFSDRGPLARIVGSFRDWGRDCYCKPRTDNTCGNRFGWKLGDLPRGYDHKDTYSDIGRNLKLSDRQAALEVSRLTKLGHFIARHRENFLRLERRLRERGLNDIIHLPVATPTSEPSWFGLRCAQTQSPFS